MLGQAGFKATFRHLEGVLVLLVRQGHPAFAGDRSAALRHRIPGAVLESTNSFQSFLSWVDAYNVNWSTSGKLLVDDPGESGPHRGAH